ncbi:FeMo cofactor biosynthesis protein NifB [Sporomusa carbonis]|uniref:nitrogenase cofactor biosynthesis protein NifB n=1 Tax=Sporomusa carbonis TaxID=3076075 RepID=UPI003A6E667D
MDSACSGMKCSSKFPPHIAEKTQKHPCYSAEAHQTYARMHLPVAPVCNIQCNYCNRKFDCVHESRPGVTSEILSPDAARHKFLWVKEKIDKLSVVGIAGPGDALANWQETKATIRLIQEIQPDIIFCLSTNGLLLPEYAQGIVDLGIHHVTVTCNAVNPEIGAKLYQHVNYNGQRLTGTEAARVLLENQLHGIEYLTNRGVMVKVNIVMVKDINDRHIPEVVKKVKELGVFITNIMPLIPAPGSNFEYWPQTSMKDINAMRDICQIDIQQMRHCKQCRADAVGLLGQDRSQEFRMCNLQQQKQAPIAAKPDKTPVKIAVATKYGKLVDLHFGHASEFQIYQGSGDEFTLLETRRVAKYCAGMPDCDTEESRREGIIDALRDCNAVLSMRIGYHAKERLRKKGIYSVESCDSVENGLHYAVEKLRKKEVI